MDVGLFGFSHTTLPFPIHLCSSCVGAHRLGPIPFQLLAKADREPRPTPEKGTPHSHVKPGKSPLTLGLIGPGALSSFGFSPSSAKLHAPHQQDPAPCDNFSLSHGPSPVALHPLLFPGGEDASPETLPACRQCGGGLPCLQLQDASLEAFGVAVTTALKQQRASKGGPRPSTPLLPTLLCFRSYAAT